LARHSHPDSADPGGPSLLQIHLPEPETGRPIAHPARSETRRIIPGVVDDWYKVSLPAKESGIWGKAKSLQDAFESLFMANFAPKNAAMFTHHAEDFENYFYYFSPDAARIARNLIESYGGVKCPAPRLAPDVILLVGRSGSRETLLASDSR